VLEKEFDLKHKLELKEGYAVAPPSTVEPQEGHTVATPSTARKPAKTQKYWHHYKG